MTTYYLLGVRPEEPSYDSFEPAFIPYGNGVSLRAEIDVEKILKGSALFVAGSGTLPGGYTGPSPKLTKAPNPSTISGHTLGILNIPKNFILHKIVVRSLRLISYTATFSLTGVTAWTGLSSKSMLTEYAVGTVSTSGKFLVQWPQCLKVAFSGGSNANRGKLSVSLIGWQFRKPEGGF